MTDKLKEAAQLALCALERVHHTTDADRIAAADAIRAALAQQDMQTCVGCNGIGMVGNILDTVTCPFCDGSCTAAPTPPAQRVMLTDDEIGEAALSAGCDPDHDDEALVVRVARAAIEAYERKKKMR